jgi:hypothetical protein
LVGHLAATVAAALTLVRGSASPLWPDEALEATHISAARDSDLSCTSACPADPEGITGITEQTLDVLAAIAERVARLDDALIRLPVGRLSRGRIYLDIEGFYKLQHTPILVERSHAEPKVDTNICSYDTARAGRS